MIDRSFRSSCRLGSAGFVLIALGACGGESSLMEEIEDTEPGAVSGELAMYIADFEDGTTERRYALRNAAGDEQQLVFQTPPDVETGARIHVWGKRSGEALEVATFKLATRQDPEWVRSQTLPLVNQPAAAPRVECPVLVRINGGAAPASITLDTIEAQFHTGPKSVNAFYVENSYGKDSVVGKTYGPFDYTMNTCDFNGLAKALTPMIPAADGCKQLGWVMVPQQQSCGWSGLASGGSPAKPARDTWFNASIGCVVSVQEPGHNYGMDHSSTLTCTNGWFSDSLATCKHNEYGDRFDPMGSGCRHMNAWQKQYSQWFGKCNAIKVTSSGTYNLLPLEKACDGIQSIQLPFPGGKIRTLQRQAGGGDSAGMDAITSYFLEYRTSNGTFDTGMTPQVFVHVGLNPPAATGATRFGPHTWLLDASATAKAGATSAQPGMLAGGSFSDPAGGLQVTVTSLDAEKAVIQVDYTDGTGGPTCIDGTTLSAPGPTTCTGAVITGDAGPPPTTGTTGTGGAGGTAGVPRDAGRDTGMGGGVAVDAGKAGAGGQAGAGGAQAGAAGTSVGQAGGVGNGGSPIGSGGAGSSTVSTTTGAAGSSGVTGPGAAPAGSDDLVGGCACRAATGSGSDGRVGGLMALGLGMLVRTRSRRRRAH